MCIRIPLLKHASSTSWIWSEANAKEIDAKAKSKIRRLSAIDIVADDWVFIWFSRAIMKTMFYCLQRMAFLLMKFAFTRFDRRAQGMRLEINGISIDIMDSVSDALRTWTASTKGKSSDDDRLISVESNILNGFHKRIFLSFWFHSCARAYIPHGWCCPKL